MSADIEKLAVFDDRIVQTRPKYAVEKGALSITNAPFNAIAATTSQHTYNIYVPSENVFVDRAVLWSSTVFLNTTLTLSQPAAAGEILAKPGRDFALCAFPLNSMATTLTATINDTTSVINTQDVLGPVLRMTDYKKNRLQRTCPTMLDKYADYDDAAGAINNPLAPYSSSSDYDNVPNGAFYLVFTDQAGNPLPANSPGPTAGLPYGTNASGVPVAPAGGAAAGATFQIYVSFRSTEKLVLSPFVFSDCHEWDTGLFGINNIQLIMNLNANAPNRMLRWTGAYGRALSQTNWNTSAGTNNSAFTNSVVNVQFLTPSLDVPLPPKSVVPYMEFPRYITQYQNGQLAAAGSPLSIGQIQSQTITLPQVPDLLIIYVKATAATGQPDPTTGQYGDFYLPLATRQDGIANPLSVNFDNFSGLLSSHTAENLYEMSVHNGLEMDWNAWSGRGYNGTGNVVPLVGGFLVLKPGRDITLQSGQAPSLVGNFTLQFNLQVRNPLPYPVVPQLYVITANSGFFESIRGSSRIIKGVLSEQDIISAPLAPSGTREGMARMVGGAGLFGSLANYISKAKDIYHQSKPLVSEVKKLLPDSGMAGKVKGALGSVGYGASGGVGMSGGMTRKGLKARLMEQ